MPTSLSEIQITKDARLFSEVVEMIKTSDDKQEGEGSPATPNKRQRASDDKQEGGESPATPNKRQRASDRKQEGEGSPATDKEAQEEIARLQEITKKLKEEKEVLEEKLEDEKQEADRYYRKWKLVSQKFNYFEESNFLLDVHLNPGAYRGDNCVGCKKLQAKLDEGCADCATLMENGCSMCNIQAMVESAECQKCFSLEQDLEIANGEIRELKGPNPKVKHLLEDGEELKGPNPKVKHLLKGPNQKVKLFLEGGELVSAKDLLEDEEELKGRRDKIFVGEECGRQKIKQLLDGGESKFPGLALVIFVGMMEEFLLPKNANKATKDASAFAHKADKWCKEHPKGLLEWMEGSQEVRTLIDAMESFVKFSKIVSAEPVKHLQNIFIPYYRNTIKKAEIDMLEIKPGTKWFKDYKNGNGIWDDDEFITEALDTLCNDKGTYDILGAMGKTSQIMFDFEDHNEAVCDMRGHLCFVLGRDAVSTVFFFTDLVDHFINHDFPTAVQMCISRIYKSAEV